MNISWLKKINNKNHLNSIENWNQMEKMYVGSTSRVVHTSYLIWKSSVWPFYLFRPGSASSCNYFYVKIVFCNNDFKPFAFFEGPVTLTILLRLLYKKQKWDISTKFRRNIHWFEWHQSQRMSLIVWLSAQRPRPPACLWGASNRVLQCARLKKKDDFEPLVIQRYSGGVQ